MGIKKSNIVTFISEKYGSVSLVRKSIGYYRDWKYPASFALRFGLRASRTMTYWRGQLASDWIATPEFLSFEKGRVVWLDAAEFKLETAPLSNYNEFPSDWTGEQIIKYHTNENYYFDVRFIPGRGWCGLQMMAFTIGLVYGLGKTCYVGRYCYHNLVEAKLALIEWNGLDDPSGDWIKHKGGIGEYPHPRYKNQKK